jgi:hypothetical protein
MGGEEKWAAFRFLSSRERDYFNLADFNALFTLIAFYFNYMRLQFSQSKV